MKRKHNKLACFVKKGLQIIFKAVIGFIALALIADMLYTPFLYETIHTYHWQEWELVVWCVGITLWPLCVIFGTVQLYEWADRNC